MNEESQISIVLMADVGEDGRRLGYFKCPECDAKQNLSVDAEILGETPTAGKYEIEYKNIQVIPPWGCAHMQEFMERVWKAAGKNKSGQPIKPKFIKDQRGVEYNITVTDKHNERGEQLGSLTCPTCGTEQPCTVKKEGSKVVRTEIDLPAACEHFTNVDVVVGGLDSPVVPACAKCGKPGAHNLSVHGILCEDCDNKKELVCDFCSAMSPPWVYPARDFTMLPFVASRSTKGWAACDACKTLIDSDQKRELGKRSVDSYMQWKIKERTFETVEQIVKAMKQMHVRFHANRHGPAIPVAEADKLMPPAPKRIAEGTAQYMAAIEKRLEWAQWAELRGQIAWRDYGVEKLGLFKYTLDHGDCYYMDQHFCELVD
jgi:hypothetical protein